MKKTLVSMQSSKFGAFQKKELKTAMMQAVTGGNIYPNTTAGSTQEESTYDKEGHLVGCRKRYDTQVVDKLTLKKTLVWGDWTVC